MGFRRPNNTAGTRNYIGVLSSVNCSTSVAKYIARHFDQSVLKDYPNVDGICRLCMEKVVECSSAD